MSSRLLGLAMSVECNGRHLGLRYDPLEFRSVVIKGK